MPSQTNSVRPIWKRLLLGISISAVLFLALELGIRFAYGPPPPPVLVSTGLQAHDEYLVEEDGMVTAVYQAAAPTAPFPKNYDGVRLMFLGGSVVHMQQFRGQTSKEFANVAGRILGVESINLGAPAMDSFDLVRIVEELEGIDHTHMIVYTGHNDFGNAYFQERFAGLSGGIFARLRRVLEHSQTYCRLRRALSNVPKAKFGEWNREGFTPQRREATLNYLRTNLERLLWIAKSRNVTMVIATPVTSLLRRPINDVCLKNQCSHDLWQQGKAMGRADPVISEKKMRLAHDMDWNSLRAPTIAVDMIREFAKTNSVPLIDVEADINREPGLTVPQDRLFMDLVHFDQNGHQVVGELIAKRIRELALLP